MGKMKFFLIEKLMTDFFSFNKYLSIKIIFYIFLPIFLIFLYLNYNNIKINYSNKFDTFKVLDFLDLKLKYINIKGLNNINKEDIIEQLKLKKTNSILFINLDNLKKQIKKFNLIETVHIERVLPNTLNIKLTEKTPIGIMQENNIYKLITKDGSILTTNNLQKFNQLPIFIGKEVEKSAKDILNLLKKVNFKEEIWSISLINERRWDLNLKKGVKILLPEEKIEEALKIIIKIQKEYNVLDGNFIEVDLRNVKQVVFQPLINSKEL